MSKALVWFAAVMFVCFGAVAIVDPSRTLDLVHLAARDATGLNEIRAMYGGVELALAAFLAATAMGYAPLRSGVLLVAIVFGAAAVARTISMMLDGMPSTEFAVAPVFEALISVLAVVVLRRDGREPGTREN